MEEKKYLTLGNKVGYGAVRTISIKNVLWSCS